MSREPSRILRARLLELESQCAQLREVIALAERRERIVSEHREAWSGVCSTAPDKIVRFLRANPTLAFSPEEILYATWTNEDAGRKALTRLYTAKTIRRVAWGWYTIVQADSATARQPQAGCV